MPEDLPPSLSNMQKKVRISMDGFEATTLEELEKRHILGTLENYNWNQKKASEILGVSTTTLWRKLKSYGIEPKRKE